MKDLDLSQGTEEWRKARGGKNTSSGAPCIMGAGHKTRDQYLDERAGWLANPNGWFKDNLFSEGHKIEALVRSMAEEEAFTDFEPKVFIATVDGVDLMASYDGVGLNGELWECKSFNATLWENVRNKVLEAKHYWQLEHLMLVAGKDTILFSVSDGTPERTEFMEYGSVPDRRVALLAEWRRLEEELKTHVLIAKVEPVEPVEIATFPLVKVGIEGQKVSTNIGEIKIILDGLSLRNFGAQVATPQQEAECSDLIKRLQAMEKALERAEEELEGGFVSFKVAKSEIKGIHGAFRALRLDRQKEKKRVVSMKKQEVIDSGNKLIESHIASLSGMVPGANLADILNDIQMPSIPVAVKGLGSPKSMKEAIQRVIAPWRSASEEVVKVFAINLDAVRGAGNKELFMDFATLCKSPSEAVKAIISSRLAEKKDGLKRAADDARMKTEEMARAEAARKDKERERLEVFTSELARFNGELDLYCRENAKHAVEVNSIFRPSPRLSDFDGKPTHEIAGEFLNIQRTWETETCERIAVSDEEKKRLEIFSKAERQLNKGVELFTSENPDMLPEINSTLKPSAQLSEFGGIAVPDIARTLEIALDSWKADVKLRHKKVLGEKIRGIDKKIEEGAERINAIAASFRDQGWDGDPGLSPCPNLSQAANGWQSVDHAGGRIEKLIDEWEKEARELVFGAKDSSFEEDVSIRDTVMAAGGKEACGSFQSDVKDCEKGLATTPLPKDGSLVTILVPTEIRWDLYDDAYMRKRGRGGPPGRWVEKGNKKFNHDPEKLERG